MSYIALLLVVKYLVWLEKKTVIDLFGLFCIFVLINQFFSNGQKGRRKRKFRT